MRAQRFTVVVVSLLLLTATGCDNTNAPSTGALQVSLVTTGGDLDLNGYTATLGSAAPLTVPANGSVIIPDLPTGSRDVTLGDVAPNCTLTGSNPRTITVVGGDTTDVAFAVACVATGVRVTTTTTGVDLDADGYAISIDGVLASVVGANGSVEITRLAVGSHTVALTAVSTNCPITGGATRSVNIGLGEIGPVAFDLTCLAVTGMIEVRAATSGIDLDTDGYTVQLDNGSASALGVNGVLRFPGLAAGDHTITFGGAAANCTAGGENPRTVSVTTGGTTRDTARTTFTVSCVALTGMIEVTAATSGVELDPDGYTVQVDGDSARPIGRNATLRFQAVSGGDHTVTLAGAAENCPIDGENPRTVPVTVGGTTRDTARTTFAVTCLATTGVLKITATTSGTELDPDGYGVYVDEVCYYDYYYGYYCYYAWSGTVGANAAVIIPGLSAGEHTLRFDGVQPNCAFTADPPGTVNVPRGDTVVVALAVTCVATGRVQVTATTTGADLDPDGYGVALSRPGFGTTVQVPANGTITIAQLVPSDYELTVNSVAPNCVVTPPNPRTVTVTSGATTVVAVDVACSALGSLQVTTSTTGVDLDPDGYNVAVSRSGNITSRHVGINETVLIAGLVAGDYELTLSGMAGNCTVTGLNPRTIAVPSGGTASVTFDLVCNPLARIQVTASTTGIDLPPAGYTIVLNGPSNSGNPLPTNGTVVLGPLPPGDYQVTLIGAPVNCEVAAPNPRTVTAVVGDTATTQFDIACTTASELAIAASLNGNTDVYRVKSNGTGLTRLTTAPASDGEAAWSPDGSKIAFTSFRDGDQEVYVMDATGSGQVRRTNAPGADFRPTWSPDGTKIAFSSSRDGNLEIYVMNADGTNPIRLTNNMAGDVDPAWSPDGSTIAFSSNRDGNFEIYMMNADGVGTPLRLTSNGVDDVQPDWSPDGQRLVFSRFSGCYGYYNYNEYCDYDLYIMDANGANEVSLTSGAWSVDSDPAWSPNGLWIAFGVQLCEPYYGCYSFGVNAVRADGSRLVAVTREGAAVNPSWRRP